MDTTPKTLMIDEIFAPERILRLGFQNREVQVDIARDIDKALCAALPAPEDVTIRQGLHKSEVWKKYQSACGFIQASPGTGKSLAALCALLRHHKRTGRRVALSTFTRALQRQILTDGDLERAQALTGITVNVAVRMGRANFISQERVEWYDALLRKEGATTDSWNEFVAWVRSWNAQTDPLETTFMAWRDSHEALPEVHGEEVAEDLLALPYRAKRAPKNNEPEEEDLEARDSEETSAPEVPEEDFEDPDAAYYAQHAAAAQTADLVITNHATVFLHGEGNGSLLGAIDAIIFDEADRLPDAALSLYTHRLRPELLLSRCERRTGRKATQKMKDIGAQISSLMRAIGEDMRWQNVTPRDLAARAPDRFQEMGDLLRKFRLRGCRQEASGLSLVRKAFRSDTPEMTDIVYIGFSPMRRYPSFCVDPDPQEIRNRLGDLITRLEPATRLVGAVPSPAESKDEDDDEIDRLTSKPLFPHAVYMSASLANLIMGEPMARVHYEYGVGPAAVVVSERHEPAVFGSMTFVLPDPRIPKPFQDRDKNDKEAKVVYHTAWLDYISAAINHDKDRRKLVLTPSFNEVRELLARRGVAVDPNGLDEHSIDLDGVRYHLPGDPGHKIARSITNPDVRAIVTPSLWEGANLVIRDTQGQARIWMEDLVITRFSTPPQESEYVLDLLRYHLMRKGKKIRTIEEADNIIRNIRDAKSLRKLLQAVGRGIRGPNDAIRIWLLDTRLKEDESWLDYVREALDARGEELPKPPSHISSAHRYWRRAIPERFQAAVDQADMFLYTGTLLEWSEISAVTLEDLYS